MTEFGWLYLIVSAFSVLMGILQFFINRKRKNWAARLAFPAVILLLAALDLLLYFGAFGETGSGPLGNTHQLTALVFGIAIAILGAADAIAWICYAVYRRAAQ